MGLVQGYEELNDHDELRKDPTWAEVERIVDRIRQKWPEVEIILRPDSGFARERIMKWCEENGVDYVFGLAKK